MAAGRAFRNLVRSAPASWAVAIATSVVFLVAGLMGWANDLAAVAGFLPERLTEGSSGASGLPAWLTPLTTLFVHVGFLQLFLNVGALLLFGRSVEGAVGSPGLLLLYVLGALAGAAMFFVLHPIGLFWLGSGGGVSAVLGAFAILFGSSRTSSRRTMSRPAYAAWLCAGWTLLSVLVLFAFAGQLAAFYAVPLIAAYVVGLALGRVLLLFKYRSA